MRLDSLLEQLKRRKVFRAAGAYVAVGLGIIYAADTILPALALPPWTVTLVIVLVGLGFPLAVGLAWAFDATGDGVVRTAEGSDQEVVTPRVEKAAPIGASEVATGSAQELTELRSRPAIVVLPYYRYFEKYCPFLEPLRDNPRFAAIVSSAREREALFENATLTSAGTESR